VAARTISRNQRGPGVAAPDPLIQAPELEEPVFISLTDEERAELSRKVADANRRSENGGGR
jgi:hypothetical protein